MSDNVALLVQMPRELRKRLKLVAVERESTLTALITEAVTAFLRRAEGRANG